MTVDEIRQALRDARLERLAEHVEKLVLPAIRIDVHPVDEDELPVGASKIGGSPDLPPGVVWPEWHDIPLTFLAQFNLLDLAPFDVKQMLPPDGMVSFFYEAGTQPWGMEPTDRGAWKVVYYDGKVADLRRVVPPKMLSKGRVLATHRVIPSNTVTLPNALALELLSSAPMGDEELDCYVDVEYAANVLSFQMLGYPHQLHDSMPLWCEVASSGRRFADIRDSTRDLTAEGRSLEYKAVDQWQLLFQLDSVPMTAKTASGYPYMLEWGLGGLLYFWIRKDDLQRRDFSHVWLQLQTT